MFQRVVVPPSFVYIVDNLRILLISHLKNEARKITRASNGEIMSANKTGTGTKLLSSIIFILIVSLTAFLVYEYSGVFKKSPQITGPEITGGAHKIDKSALIANLEKKIRAIPAEDFAANLDGYKRLLRLSPGNARYRQKVAYYSDRLNEAGGDDGKRIGIREYIKVGYPSPRVLTAPETGEMMGRVDSGSMVEILDLEAIESASLKMVWYKIEFGKQAGWISQLGTTGNVIIKTIDPEKMAGDTKQAAGTSPWEKLAATMIDDYGGKIISIDRLDINESHFSLSSGMNTEQVRQTCENIGYYIRNTTGESPVIVAFIDNVPVAKAHPAGTKYQGALVTN